MTKHQTIVRFENCRVNRFELAGLDLGEEAPREALPCVPPPERVTELQQRGADPNRLGNAELGRFLELCVAY